jgi:hypothetical protein
MKQEDKGCNEPKRTEAPPGFILQEDIGLGDVVKKATSHVGIRPCGGCERRRALTAGHFYRRHTT